MRESMRKQGRTPSAKALQLAGWLLLLTNAPAAKLPAAMMSYVYRLRWQVELIFRQAKSVLRLDKTASTNSHRVQSEIWARLICAVLLFSWHAQASAECWQRHACEASFEKLIRMAQHWGHTLARACVGGPDEFLQVLRTLWKHILVNARKGRQKSRPTTWEILFNLWLNPLAAAT
jgi:sugar diacid utilization regulator